MVLNAILIWRFYQSGFYHFFIGWRQKTQLEHLMCGSQNQIIFENRVLKINKVQNTLLLTQKEKSFSNWLTESECWRFHRTNSKYASYTVLFYFSGECTKGKESAEFFFGKKNKPKKAWKLISNAISMTNENFSLRCFQSNIHCNKVT